MRVPSRAENHGFPCEIKLSCFWGYPRDLKTLVSLPGTSKTIVFNAKSMIPSCGDLENYCFLCKINDSGFWGLKGIAFPCNIIDFWFWEPLQNQWFRALGLNHCFLCKISNSWVWSHRRQLFSFPFQINESGFWGLMINGSPCKINDFWLW